jgi:copper(I)-binding protein
VIKRLLLPSSSAWPGLAFAAIAAVLLSTPSWAAPPAVEVTDAWVRATVPGQPVAGAYLTIRSRQAAQLVGVKSAVAKSAEIHSMSDEAGVMRMRKLEALALPAGEPVELKSGGNHIMLLEIKRQLKAGEKVPLTLTVEQGGKKKAVAVEAEVREAK